MSGQLLNLPTNIPWKQIAVSEDMMDEKFCNKLFPFAWRSSMAISAYEPDPTDLPKELCGDRITYLKITTSITGYQPSSDETKRLNENLEEGLRRSFPDIPTEDLNDGLERITNEYFACYGVHLNVAVFPYPNTKKELIERLRIDFSELKKPNSQDFLEPGATLANPFEHSSGVNFEVSDQPQNQLVNIITQGNGTDAELNLYKKMVISIPATAGLAAVEAKVTYANTPGVKMEAFRTGVSVGTASTEAEPKQVHTLLIKADDIDTVVITAPENEASLLEFAYFLAKDVPLTLKDYPHIIDFEPKRRDLYQAATEAGEVLTGSKSALSTTKALTHTESTENSVSFDAGVKGVIPIPELPIGVDASVKTMQINKETDQDQWSVQTDASRERRETQGTTTQLSQMYNLMTGYHAGTNRASFLSLARPHVLQPTDFRTFVQGLRAIEGMQDYFLIVSRPKDSEGLCIEASLETGNYPENTVITEPPVEYDEDFLDFPFSYRAKGAKGASLGDWNGSPPECVDINEVVNIPLGYILDQRPERKREGSDLESGWYDYPGVAIIGQNDQTDVQDAKNLTYQISDGALNISGTLCGFGESGLGTVGGRDAIFVGSIRVFLRSEEPKTNYKEPFADIGSLLITSRSLCTCFKSEDCIEVVQVPPSKEDPIIIDRILDEIPIRLNKAIMTKHARIRNRMPLSKAFLSKVQTALTRRHISLSRRSLDDKIGFLESDYFKNQIKQLLPKQYLKSPISRVKGLSAEVVKALGDDFTIEQALSIDLARFARRTGLNIKEASKARQLLLGISQKGDSDKSNSGSEQIS